MVHPLSGFLARPLCEQVDFLALARTKVILATK